MSSLNLELRNDSGVTFYQVPVDGIVGWWQGLVERNAKSRMRDEQSASVEAIPDQCPFCEADPVHFTLVQRGCTQRICRKCDSVLEDLVWVL